MNMQNDDEFLELRKKVKKYASQSKSGLNSTRFDSSDITQLTCIQIWQAWQDVEDAGISEFVSNSQFLKKICHGKAANLIRFHSTHKRSVKREVGGLEPTGQTEGSPFENAAKNEQMRLLLGAIAQLDEQYRRLITMRYQMSMTLEEIADALGKNVNWVHRHLQKSLAQISGHMPI